MNLTIGIDPGKAGGIVVLDEHRTCVLAWAADEKPKADRVGGYFLGEWPDVRGILDELRALDGRVVNVTLETCMVLRGQGAAVKIAGGWGHLRAAVLAAGLPLDEVTPAAWSRAILGAPPKGGWVDGAKKQAAIDVVRAKLPTVGLVLPGRRVPHDGLADAACLALYGMR